MTVRFLSLRRSERHARAKSPDRPLFFLAGHSKWGVDRHLVTCNVLRNNSMSACRNPPRGGTELADKRGNIRRRTRPL